MKMLSRRLNTRGIAATLDTPATRSFSEICSSLRGVVRRRAWPSRFFSATFSTVCNSPDDRGWKRRGSLRRQDCMSTHFWPQGTSTLSSHAVGCRNRWSQGNKRMPPSCISAPITATRRGEFGLCRGGKDVTKSRHVSRGYFQGYIHDNKHKMSSMEPLINGGVQKSFFWSYASGTPTASISAGRHGAKSLAPCKTCPVTGCGQTSFFSSSSNANASGVAGGIGKKGSKGQQESGNHHLSATSIPSIRSIPDPSTSRSRSRKQQHEPHPPPPPPPSPSISLDFDGLNKAGTNTEGTKIDYQIHEQRHRLSRKGRMIRELSSLKTEAPSLISCFYVGRSINVMRLFQRYYMYEGLYPLLTDKRCVIVRLRESALRPSSSTLLHSSQTINPTKDPTDPIEPLGSYGIFFSYGAVCFVNCGERRQREEIANIKIYVSGEIPHPTHEEILLKVVEGGEVIGIEGETTESRHGLEESKKKVEDEDGGREALDGEIWRKQEKERELTGNNEMREKETDKGKEVEGLTNKTRDEGGLQGEEMAFIHNSTLHVHGELDVNSLRVISNVMGQSAALHYYEQQVDDMMGTFSRLNAEISLEGDLDKNWSKRLFRLIAANNATLTDGILNVGLGSSSSRPGMTSWQEDALEALWEVMREEYELGDRFEDLEGKVEMIRENTKFFVEVLHSKRSDRLELAIIALIAFELGFEIYDHIPQGIIDAIKATLGIAS